LLDRIVCSLEEEGDGRLERIMCFECRILGALVNGGRPEEKRFSFSTSLLREFDFSPSVIELEDKGLRDVAAEEYLKDTLDYLADTFQLELVPIKVDSDGSCLPHAASRCLVGKEILYDALRLELEWELRENAEFYRGLLGQSMDDETFESYWEGIVNESKPVHGVMTGRWLGPEHIIGLANVLRRPILLLDRLEAMKKEDHRSGLFLPLRHERHACLSTDGLGDMPSPLVIGWANAENNHFISLVVPSRNRLLATEEEEWTRRARKTDPELWNNIDCLMDAQKTKRADAMVEITIPEDKKPGDVCVLQNPKNGDELIVQIPPGKKPGDIFFWDPDTSNMLSKLYGALVHFFATNPPVLRQKSASTLHTVLKNLIDALLMDQSKLAQRSKIRLGNKVIERTVVRTNGALEILRAVGFEDWRDDSQPDERFLHFKGDLNRTEFCETLILARDALVAIRANVGVVRGAGQIPVERESDAFGPLPAFLPHAEDVWGRFRQFCFNFDPARPNDSGAWVFGMGNQLRLREIRMVNDMVKELKKRFTTIAQGSGFEDMDWDDEILYSQRLKHIRCPQCERDQEWNHQIDGFRGDMIVQTCEKCQADLGVDLTGQRQMSSFIHHVLSERKSSFCKQHDQVFLKKCPACY